MQRIPIILAGLAAAAIFARVYARKPGIFRKNNKDNELQVVPVEVENTAGFIETEPEEIIQVKHLTAFDKLEAKYPGLRHFQSKVPVAQR
jgi:thioredoxin reductase